MQIPLKRVSRTVPSRNNGLQPTSVRGAFFFYDRLRRLFGTGVIGYCRGSIILYRGGQSEIAGRFDAGRLDQRRGCCTVQRRTDMSTPVASLKRRASKMDTVEATERQIPTRDPLARPACQLFSSRTEPWPLDMGTFIPSVEHERLQSSKWVARYVWFDEIYRTRENSHKGCILAAGAPHAWCQPRANEIQQRLLRAEVARCCAADRESRALTKHRIAESMQAP